MKNTLFGLILGIATISFTTGCATIISGTSEPVTLNSSPEGATITQNGLILGKTPTTLVLKRESHPIVEISKEGYQKQSVSLDTSFNPWILTNVIWCMSCVFSTTTDYTSGAAWQYSPNHYYTILYTEGTTPSPSDVKKNTVKAYIINNYNDIMKAVISATNKGASEIEQVPNEYLKTLYVMMEIPDPKRPEALAKIKKISDSSKDIVKFADDVVNALI